VLILLFLQAVEQVERGLRRLGRVFQVFAQMSDRRVLFVLEQPRVLITVRPVSLAIFSASRRPFTSGAGGRAMRDFGTPEGYGGGRPESASVETT
jgi:hypothetical protein